MVAVLLAPNQLCYFIPFFSPISWYPIGTVAATPIMTREKQRSRATHPPKHNPTKPHCFLTQLPIQPGSQPHQCVGGNTVHLATVSACTVPGSPQGSLPPEPSLNPDDTGPIVRRRLRQSLDSNPESPVARIALQCSALDHCATWEAPTVLFCLFFSIV